ncbi:hypothetical protein ST47_g574 [Ascochyta rabiei]|uniref:Thiaminase-2/PQQC domain-containing protein n=1 Tax=Didymella rabiei TaxID=5454 RepID=A0A163M0B4_DIDRA|nr:hypothetical protein ST47_g574 [Ascochyta rabiei]
MVQHHPGAFVSKANLDPTDVPWALTTHLLSISIPQFKRTTTAPFLARAAQGQLPKPLIAEWLANDRLYIQGYITLAENLTRIVKSSTSPAQQANVESIEARLLRWLDAAIENVKREFEWFDEMTRSYNLTSPAPTSSEKSLGVQRFEALFSQLSTQSPNEFLPWLEAAVCLFSTEKVYFEAWSWARKQDRRRSASPLPGSGASRSRSPNRTTMDYSKDLDGGAMRKEFIPNWSNKNFMMFVETLERIINEGVSQAVAGDDKRWEEVKQRASAVWQATLDAEEAFWPAVDGASNATHGADGESSTTELRGLIGAKDGSLLEPNKHAYDRDTRTLSVGQEGTYVPHLGHV